MSISMKELGARAVLQELRLDVISNNLANVNTTGFKEDTVAFRIPSQGVVGTTRERWIWDPYKTAETTIQLSQGQLRETGGPLDLALHGDGFFCVQGEFGEEYTRRGDFKVNAEGVLVTAGGLPVLGRRGEIRLRGGDVQVDDRGNIIAGGVPVDAIKIVDVEDPAMLSKSGDAMYRLHEDEKPVEADNVTVRQGFLESSNVQPIKAMTDMIDVLRTYESYNKILQVLNETTQKSINEVGRLK